MVSIVESDPLLVHLVFRLHELYINSIEHKQKSTLKFKVTNMFALGSPLGVFLTLRGIRPKANGLLDNVLPKALCNRFYNIYHPYDPIVSTFYTGPIVSTFYTSPIVSIFILAR